MLPSYRLLDDEPFVLKRPAGDWLVYYAKLKEDVYRDDLRKLVGTTLFDRPIVAVESYATVWLSKGIIIGLAIEVKHDLPS